MKELQSLFEPESVAVVVGTEKKGSVGHTVLTNLLSGKDKRRIYPVNPKRETLLDTECYPDITSLPEIPDMVVIAAPASSVHAIIKESCQKGIKTAVLLKNSPKESSGKEKNSEQEILSYAREHGMRIVGPDCLGIMRPHAGFNATITGRTARPGGIAFLSQNGALGTAVLDWAVSRDIGFSAFVSLGAMRDIDFGDLIDILGEDQKTKSIIIYLESIGTNITSARKFMSAARGFARSKPIIVIKPGKYSRSFESTHFHFGPVLGKDVYYNAVLDRAGTVRVEEIEDLFNCASILNTTRLPERPDLAIISNDAGPAVLATDALMSREGGLAELSDTTVQKLSSILPSSSDISNPLNIPGDSDEKRYMDAINCVLKDPSVSGAIVVYTPQGAVSPVKLANSLVKCTETTKKPILAVMMGTEDMTKARQILYNNSIPTYDFPEKAVKTYMYMYRYSRTLEELYEEPEDIPLNLGVPKNYLKILTRNAARQGKFLLNEVDSMKLITTYGIPAATTRLAKTADEARMIARAVGYPVTMKISSPDVSHKSDVGGVCLNLRNENEVTQAYDRITADVKSALPDAAIDGITVQPMVPHYDYELIIGSRKDSVLGPVILFGLGGSEAAFLKDIAVGLPPFNQNLARKVIEETRAYSLLSEGYRTKPPANLLLLDEILVKVSNLIVDFPEIQELDISPMVISGDTVKVIDARIRLDPDWTPGDKEEYSHLVISPYPTRYIQPWRCHDSREVILRPIRPEDEPLERELLANLSPESSRYRFFQQIKDISHELLSRFCNIDYDREMAIIAEYTSGGHKRNVGVGRLIVDRENSGEFAVLIADDFQSLGLGLKLTDTLIGIAREKGLDSIYGIVLNDNAMIIGLARKVGFTIEKINEDESKMTLVI